MDAVEELKKLKSLLDQNVISSDEFNILKQKLMTEVADFYKFEATPGSNKNKKTTNAKKKAVKSTSAIRKPPVRKKTPGSRTVSGTKVKKVPVASLNNPEKGINESSKASRDIKKPSQNDKKAEHTKGSGVIPVLISAVLLILFIIGMNLESGAIWGFILLMVPAFFYWMLKIGRRRGYYFFLPYIIFLTGVIMLMEGKDGLRASNREDHVEDFETVMYSVFIIITIAAFLIEYFLAQPKCYHCNSRLWMKKISESDFDSYSYIGTKNYAIRSKSGEKIGEYEGPVSRTTYTYTAHYFCEKCQGISNRGESDTYDH